MSGAVKLVYIQFLDNKLYIRLVAISDGDINLFWIHIRVADKNNEAELLTINLH